MRCNRCNREIDPRIPICPWCGFDNSIRSIQGNQQQGYSQQNGYPQWQEANRNPGYQQQESKLQDYRNRPNSQPVNQHPVPQKPENRNTGKSGSDRGNRKTILAICISGGVVLVVLVVALVLLLSGKKRTKTEDSTSLNSEFTTDDYTGTSKPGSETENTQSSDHSTEEVTTDSTGNPSGGSESLEDLAKDKLRRDGFSSGSTHTFTFEDYIYDIPDYMGEAVDVGSSKTFYPELGSNPSGDVVVVCMTITETKQYGSGTIIRLDDFWKEADDSTIQNCQNVSNGEDVVVLVTENLTINGLYAHRLDLKYNMMGIDVLFRSYAILDESAHKFFIITFQESMSSAYTYFSDFDQIVLSTRKY